MLVGTERSGSSFSSSIAGGTKLTYADLGGAGWGMEASHRPTFAGPVAAFHAAADSDSTATFQPAIGVGSQGRRHQRVAKSVAYAFVIERLCFCMKHSY